MRGEINAVASSRPGLELASAALLLLGEKRPERAVDLVPGIDADQEEVGVLQPGQGGVQPALGTAGLLAAGTVKAPPPAVADLAVAHHAADVEELAHQLAAALVVGGEVLPVRKMKGVVAPLGGRVILPDVAEGQPIGGRAAGAAAAGNGEKLLLRDDLGFDVVGDEDQVDLPVLAAQEAGEPEVEALGDVPLFRRHG